MGIFTLFSQAAPLPVGSDAPQLSAIDQDGNAIDLGKIFAQGTTLVYFYPKADTGGCTAQACSLRDSITDLKDLGVNVIGVSRDKPEAQKKFQEKYQLPFPLVADHDGAVAKAFGVPGMLGLPVTSRQSFLVRDGKIVWFTPSAKTSGHAKEIQEALKNLQS